MWMVQPPPWFTFIVTLNCQDMHMHRCHRWDAQKTSVWEAMHLTCLRNIALSIVCFSRSLAWNATCLICEAKCTNWDLEFRDMFLDFLTTLPEPKDRQWHGYRPRLTTAFCKKYRHVFSCLWQEHSSDSVEGYELYRCIYDHLDSGTHLLFDCDCVIFYFDRPGDIFPWNSNWMHSEHINGRIASIFSRRLDVSNASCSQFRVNLMHTSRTHEVPGVHEFTTPGIYLTSHFGTALSYATPTRLACDQLNSDNFRFAYCGTIGSKREAVFRAKAERPTAALLSSSVAGATPVSKRLRCLSCFYSCFRF